MNTTGNWTTWTSKTVSNIELIKGKHILRLAFSNGEFNLGKMTFERSGDLSYNPPEANAGENVVVVLPESTAILDASLSTDADSPNLNYNWEQVYGPSTITFDDATAIKPMLSNLIEGIYKVKLIVDDGSHSSSAFVLVIVSATGNSDPSISLIAPADNSTFKQGEDITITASASDLDGNVVLVEFFDGSVKIGEALSEPYTMIWTDAGLGAHELSAKATDNGGAAATSQVRNISVNEIKACIETSDVAQQGAFSVGYKSTFETVGTDVTVTFELLDTDKSGVIAYLWQESPFSESQMDNVSGNIFSKTLSGLTNGSTISYACKFAYAGGLSVTKYISYVVGNDCSGTNDTEPPANFTASLGAVSASSVELLLNGSDNSGTIIYEVSYGATTKSMSSGSGTQTSFTIAALSPSTLYNFSVIAKDLAGNRAVNNPIVIQATTSDDTSTACNGSSADAQQGAFDLGYNYDFQTNGSDVTITFELLDERDGLIAYLWEESPFTETPMANVSGKIFTVTLSGQSSGEVLSVACKFAFAGGLSVTKYFSYVVGSDCATLGVGDETLNQSLSMYPNPAGRLLHIESQVENITQVELYTILGEKLIEYTEDFDSISLEGLTGGIYLVKIHVGQRYVVKELIKE